jgi:hypothetical protein
MGGDFRGLESRVEGNGRVPMTGGSFGRGKGMDIGECHGFFIYGRGGSRAESMLLFSLPAKGCAWSRKDAARDVAAHLCLPEKDLYK